MREEQRHDRDDDEGEGKDDKGECRLRLRGGFEFLAWRGRGGQLPDGEKRDHQLPGIVIERAAKLGDEQSAQWMSHACDLVRLR